jgi:hypothetical protein
VLLGILPYHSVFSQVQVDPALGTVSWPNGADLDPDSDELISR